LLRSLRLRWRAADNEEDDDDDDVDDDDDGAVAMTAITAKTGDSDGGAGDEVCVG
jgi:hypothetical protein